MPHFLVGWGSKFCGRKECISTHGNKRGPQIECHNAKLGATIAAVRKQVSKGMYSLAMALVVHGSYDIKLRESFCLFRGGEGVQLKYFRGVLLVKKTAQFFWRRGCDPHRKYKHLNFPTICRVIFWIKIDII